MLVTPRSKLGKKAATDMSRKKKRDQKDPSRRSIKSMGRSSPAASCVWKLSKCTERDLQRLVAEGLIHDKGVVKWRPSGTDAFPLETPMRLFFLLILLSGFDTPPF